MALTFAEEQPYSAPKEERMPYPLTPHDVRRSTRFVGCDGF